MKLLISFLLLSTICTAQSKQSKKEHEFANKPIGDTVYVYIEGIHKYNPSKDSVEVWQRDLQTGIRWYSVCPKNNHPITGSVKRLHRNELVFLKPKNAR